MERKVRRLIIDPMRLSLISLHHLLEALIVHIRVICWCIVGIRHHPKRVWYFSRNLLVYFGEQAGFLYVIWHLWVDLVRIGWILPRYLREVRVQGARISIIVTNISILFVLLQQLLLRLPRKIGYGLESAALLLRRLHSLNFVLLFIFVEFYTLFETATIGTFAGHSFRFLVQLRSKGTFLSRLFCLFDLTGNLPLRRCVFPSFDLVVEVFLEFLRHNQSLVWLFLLTATCLSHLVASLYFHNRLFPDRELITILSLIVALILRGHHILIFLNPLVSEFPTLMINLRLMSCSAMTLGILIDLPLGLLLGKLLNLLFFLLQYFFVSLMNGPWIYDVLLLHFAHLLFGQLHLGSVWNGIAFLSDHIIYTSRFIFLAPLGVRIKSWGHRLEKFSINLILFKR